ncbi:membrane protein [Cellulomonas hominis]|uniref:Membrane protein n=1 Tax=Cellulomonas hominis TaxID=156981 RepID=A0A511FHL7_9CELL|nr:DoxX family protein [Cellulomonas hominis]MBB5471685.1 thiosulfate dehydrogenase [quinone] large subunit [Cellulomonas hominis]NKY08160.1 DoxX family protein [Cellulomonas hominis]NKY10205.1 DoxX family protein [Cellulomonas hominis]GEL48749.1 membrane protein [Cellulomonas hominis]
MTATATPRSTVPAPLPVQEDLVTSVNARRALAVTRLATGFIFLWAFLDKTFGLGYATPSERAWINGGTPSQGFLNGDAVVGPFKGFFQGIASPATDVLFMLGMLGVGLAVMLGIGLRVAAWSGSIIMVMMWMAEWPLVEGSTNPLVDYHIVYALVLVVSAVCLAGDTWGLGRWWRELPLVRQQRWLR